MIASAGTCDPFRRPVRLPAEQEAYWHMFIAGEARAAEIPPDFPRPPAQVFVREECTLELDPKLYLALRAFCESAAITLFEAALAVTAILFHRWTLNDQIVIGTLASAGADNPNERARSPFVNPVAIRIDMTAGPCILDLVARVVEAVGEAAANRDYPYQEVARLAVRDPGRAPVFQVMVLHAPRESRSRPDDVEHYCMACDLVLTVLETPDSAVLRCEYDRALYRPATVERLLSQLALVLRGITSGHDRIDSIPLSEPGARLETADWSGPEVQAPLPSLCIHRLFEAQVQRAPDEIALVLPASGAARRITYRQLDERANQLARYLSKRGVSAETVVGICLPRSLDFVIALLGVWKAGGACLPLDPGFPEERLAWILDDARAALVLSHRPGALRLRSSGLAAGLCLDDAAAAINLESSDVLDGGATGENVAYIIYTSGSTGMPKGTLVPHRSVPGLILDVPFLHTGNSETFLLYSSISWDAAALELWGALLTGSRCVIHPEEQPTPAGLARVIAGHEVSVVWLTASLFNVMVNDHPEALARVGQILAGGEPLSVEHVRRALAIAPRSRLTNGYGPTECMVFAACHRIAAPLDNALQSVPIGAPVGDRIIRLLDARMRPVPIGVIGEIYIGGAGVARGYLRRPRLTAELFVPDPFGAQPGARLYRSGDLARYRPDGTLEFVGRRDRQVKVRGFRIELGEVEAVLRQHPAVREVAVALREDQPGEKRLVAYMVVKQQPATSEELRHFLRKKLPAYMVPSEIVMLAELPRTSTGKLDRQRLPLPGRESREFRVATAYVGPCTPAEAVLARIFGEVLGMDRVGIHDSFFNLGGHSLLAARVVARVRAEFDADLSLFSMFEHSTVAQLAASLETPSLQISGAARIQVASSSRKRFPASHAQRRLWFVEQWRPGLPTYNIPLRVHLWGALDVGILERSVHALVARHEALRTTISTDKGELVQVIVESAAVSLAVEDLTGGEAAVLERRIAEEARRPFDLAKGPLLRVWLWRLGPAEYVLGLTVHHAIADGWSVGVMLRDLSALYEAGVAGGEVALPELPIQYADYAVWQVGWLAAGELEKQRAYWRSQLAGAPLVLRVPGDAGRPAVQRHRGATRPFHLPGELIAALRKLGGAEDATLFMVLLAGFVGLLHRYTGEDDLLVGIPIANRTRVETESTVGLLANLVAIRGDVKGRPRWRELLGRVRRVLLEAYAHQEFPFEQLVEELQPERETGHSPVVQVVFGMHESLEGRLVLPGLRARVELEETGTSKYDVTVLVHETAAGVTGTVEYDTDLFTAETVERWLGHYRKALAGMAANPEERVEETALLSEAERRQLLGEWNATDRALSAMECIHDLVAAQAMRTPEAIAVVCGADRLSYAELEERANRLAHWLRGREVGPEVRVGLCLDRSAELIVAILAVLKAGGAYVPLDPAYPEERLAWMAGDAGLGTVLTESQVQAGLGAFAEQWWCLDRLGEELSKEPEWPPSSGASPGNAAYVIYTSGSTGQPKGTVVSHIAVISLVWNTDYVDFSPNIVIAQAANASFDATTFEIWGALCHGGRIAIIDTETLLYPLRLAASLRELKITTMFLSVALFNQVARDVPQAFATLRDLLVGGDVADPARMREVLEQGPPQRLLNVYGPTETTTFASWQRVSALPEEIRTVPIGQPIANTRVYVLEPGGEPAPIGVTGEIYIGGTGLARGYLGRPQLTAERFVPDPFCVQPGARLYRTGDMARYRADGAVEFVGRRDRQVKVRGFRVELDEIEAVISGHPSVRDAAVVALAGKTSERRLFAFVVPRELSRLDEGELREYLRNRVPGYMIPTAFQLRSEMPLTPNGKIDRTQLRAASETKVHEAPGISYVAPRTPVEEVLAAIWGQVLSIDRVGAHDDFFDLGGHSLAAAQLTARVRSVFRIELTLKVFFENRTVAGLAAAISAGETQRGQCDRIARLLHSVQAMSPEERQVALHGQERRVGQE